MRYYVLVLFAVFTLIPSAIQAKVEYTVTDLTGVWQNNSAFLGQINWGTSWYANALNDQGQVVGTVMDMDTPDGPDYALLWDEANGLREIGNLGIAESNAVGINNHGQIVGFSTTPAETSENKYPFLWSDSTGMRSLGSLKPNPFFGCPTSANDINDHGAVVGTSDSDEMTFGGAFIWTEDAGMQPIGDFSGGLYSYALAINNSGQVVGYGDTVPGLERLERAYVWDADSGAQLLPLIDDDPSPTTSEACDINDQGDIVGSMSTSDNSFRLATIWRDGEAIDLGNLGGTYASAHAINESGVIVGTSGATGYTYSHAFIWDEGRGMRDLNELIDPALGIELAYAYDVNNNGWILAFAQYSGHCILLKPVPEPGTTVLLLGVLFCLPFFFRVKTLSSFLILISPFH